MSTHTNENAHVASTGGIAASRIDAFTDTNAGTSLFTGKPASENGDFAGCSPTREGGERGHTPVNGATSTCGLWEEEGLREEMEMAKAGVHAMPAIINYMEEDDNPAVPTPALVEESRMRACGEPVKIPPSHQGQHFDCPACYRFVYLQENNMEAAGITAENTMSILEPSLTDTKTDQSSKRASADNSNISKQASAAPSSTDSPAGYGGAADDDLEGKDGWIDVDIEGP